MFGLTSTEIAMKGIEMYMGHRESLAHDERARHIIREISQAIIQARQDIINQIQHQVNMNLEGDLVGIASSLRDYTNLTPDRDPAGFLNQILFQVAQTHSDLQVIVNNVVNGDNGYHQAMECYPLYITAYSLYVIVLQEQRNPGNNGRIQELRQLVLDTTGPVYEQAYQFTRRRFVNIRGIPHQLREVTPPEGTNCAIRGRPFNLAYEHCWIYICDFDGETFYIPDIQSQSWFVCGTNKYYTLFPEMRPLGIGDENVFKDRDWNLAAEKLNEIIGQTYNDYIRPVAKLRNNIERT